MPVLTRLLRVAGSAVLIALAIVAPARAQDGPARPNIVFTLTDDEDLGIHARMPDVQALIEAEGVTFDNFFATYPLCCPSRASILRGQYPHNTLVLGNLPPEGSFQTFRRLNLESSTIATWLRDAGYRTAFYGKYLNGYTETDPPPPGWDEWHAANNDGYFMVLNNDLAPTFAAWADVATPDFADGRSLVPLVANPDLSWRRSFLIQRLDLEADERVKPGNALAIRTERYTYVAYDTGEHERYDLDTDPDQLESIEFTADETLVDALATRLIELNQACRGQGCRDLENRPIE